MKSSTLLTVTVFALVLSFLPEVGSADSTVEYKQPTYKGYRLDWCRIFEHDCGKGAADAYCQAKGHLRADSWKVLEHPGVKTMTIGQNSICDPQHHRCDTFLEIRCTSKETTFHNPEHQGYPLDWCRVFEKDCGKGAAKQFCQSKGFNTAVSFAKANRLSVKTMTIGQNSICDPQYHTCDSFKWIKCGQ